MRPRILVIAALCLLIPGAAPADTTGRSQAKKMNLSYQTPDLSMSVTFLDPDNFMDAGQEAELAVEVKNGGTGKAYDVKLSYEGQLPKGLMVRPSTADFGTVQSGETKRAVFMLSASDELPLTTAGITFTLTEGYGAKTAPMKVNLACRAFVPPELVVADNLVVDREGDTSFGNGNGRVEPGEMIALPVLIQNIGQGFAEGVSVKFVGGGGLLTTSRTEFSLGDMEPGAERRVEFSFSVPEKYDGPASLPITLEITEKKGRFGKTAALPKPVKLNERVAVNTELRAREVNIQGRVSAQKMDFAPSRFESGMEWNVPVTKVKNRRAVAVVIGNADYRGETKDVNYAVNDARLMKRFLTDVFGYEDGNIIMLENATSAEMRDIFGMDAPGRLRNIIQNPAGTDVFIYYSGHGAPDPGTKKCYFVPVDCDNTPSSLRNNGYPVELLYQKLDEIGARSTTVVMDACFSGVSEASPVVIDVVDPAQQLKNGAVFTSCAKEEISSWHAESQHGLFTYVFLRTVRDMVESGANTITAGDIYKVVSDKQEGVPFYARSLYNGRPQNPQFKGDRERILVKLK
ncbi:caspase family protein [bacterium]|nr:caspase family protein [bacterium]